MTRDEAIERCVKATLRRLKQPDHSWRESPQLEPVEKIIDYLEALELFKPTN
jgi:hypothetical protein